MAKKEFSPRSLPAVTLLLSAMALLIWLVSMYCLTSVTAEYAAARYMEDHGQRADRIADMSFYNLREEYNVLYQNFRRSRSWEAVSMGEFSTGSPISAQEDRFLQRRRGNESFSATGIYDAQGNCMEGSWTDFFYFEYLTEEQWAAREERSHNNARALFDREKLTETGRTLLADGFGHFDARAMRFTGAFDGVEFLPTGIDYIDWVTFDEALRDKGSGEYTVSGVVQDYDLPWVTLYEDPEALPAGAEVVTLYSDWSDVCFSQPSPPFTYNEKKYGDIAALVQELGPTLADGYQNLTRYEGLDLLIVSVSYRQLLDGNAYFDPNYYGPDAYEGQSPALDFYIVSSVYCSPWRTAFRELRDVYLWTFLLGTALVLYVRSRLNRQLIRPAKLVGGALSGGQTSLSKNSGDDWTWLEGQILEQCFRETVDLQRARKNEITRLETALDYARDAEQNRRQMVSGIAHELKTPLAVVHSYTEGLKEHIAEEKREKYLDVILSETERMDGMVLEMLDLSRLEAGKVKLSRDDFSLAELAREVFEKLDMAAKAKDLRVDLAFSGSCMVSADEGRIRQVVENFATNAIKYTPEGGRISVRVQTVRLHTTFTVENDCERLSDEALSRVWDTFYRADEARTAGGTGLGLAISRAIIELHGGTCSARSTDSGVAFSFTI